MLRLKVILWALSPGALLAGCGQISVEHLMIHAIARRLYSKVRDWTQTATDRGPGLFTVLFAGTPHGVAHGRREVSFGEIGCKKCVT